MLKGGDMIAGLTHLPEYKVCEGVKLKRAFVGDKDKVLAFIKENFDNTGWMHEAEHALMADVSKCFIATENGEILGFACFDSSAKGFFGPIGVSEKARGKDIGKVLLLRTLEAMSEYGYAYAVIGWVNDAEMFYRKTVGAEFIPNGNTENSVYSNLVFM